MLLPNLGCFWWIKWTECREVRLHLQKKAWLGNAISSQTYHKTGIGHKACCEEGGKKKSLYLKILFSCRSHERLSEYNKCENFCS